MKISKIKISNFRSIDYLEIDNPSQLCAILGPNSAGKSNVLKAIDLVLGESWATKGSVKKELFYNPDKELSIEIYFSEPIECICEKRLEKIKCISLKMTCYGASFSADSRLWKDSYGDSISGYKKEGYYLSDDFKHKCSFVYIPSQRELSDQMRVSNWTMLGKIMQKIYQNYCDSFGTILEGEDKGEINRKNGEEVLQTMFKEKMRIPKDFLEENFSEQQITFGKFKAGFIENCTKLSLGLANTFSPELDIYDINWFYKTLQIHVTEDWRSSQQFNALEVGSGMQNLLLLAIFQTYAELMGDQVIFGIEEPELFLYPNAQRGLYKTLRKLSEKTQIFYTTHNPNFLDALYPEEIMMLRKDTEGTQLVEKKLKNYNRNSDVGSKIYTHFNIERNEIFFANRVVLVEGPTEKIIFSTLCERIDIDIESLGVNIIECSSKTGVLYFVGVCRLSGINYFASWDVDLRKGKDAVVEDKYKHFGYSLENGIGIEMDDDIEDEIIKSGFSDYHKYGKNEKIRNAYEWSSTVDILKIPKKFKSILEYIKTGAVIEKKGTTSNISIEDIPF